MDSKQLAKKTRQKLEMDTSTPQNESAAMDSIPAIHSKSPRMVDVVANGNGKCQEASTPTVPDTADLETELDAMSFDPNLRKKKRPNKKQDPGSATESDAKTVKTVGIVTSPTAIVDEDGNVSIEQSVSHAHPGIPETPEETSFYTYQELLCRAFAIMGYHPSDSSSDKKPFMPKAPSVVPLGSKRTCITNFPEMVRSLKRQGKHVQSFILSELGTDGSTDSNGCLIIKGKFKQSQIENVIRKYIKEYVTCHTCRSPETNLEKEDRLSFLKCAKCNSRCSVASIKAGFHAQVGRRLRVEAC